MGLTQSGGGNIYTSSRVAAPLNPTCKSALPWSTPCLLAVELHRVRRCNGSNQARSKGSTLRGSGNQSTALAMESKAARCELKVSAVGWCGVVWCHALVWCSVVWCGVVLCCVVVCGVVLCCVVLCGVVWCGVVLCCVVLCGVVWCGVVGQLVKEARKLGETQAARGKTKHSMDRHQCWLRSPHCPC